MYIVHNEQIYLVHIMYYVHRQYTMYDVQYNPKLNNI